MYRAHYTCNKLRAVNDLTGHLYKCVGQVNGPFIAAQYESIK